MLASTTTNIAYIILFVIVAGYVAYAMSNRKSARPELGSEIELAPNRKQYYDDEILEGRRLERVQFIGLLFLVVSVVGLPLYWVLEPSRLVGAKEYSVERATGWGEELFQPTAKGGFNCAGCHGGMTATGGVAAYAITDPKTNEVKAVSWKAPALNAVFYRYTEEEVRFILNYGRPFSPMSPWGLAGGGPMNAQQIDNLIAYLKSIQLPRSGCAANEPDDRICPTGTLEASQQQAITDSANKLVADGTYKSYGEALFNLDTNSGAYSCARCHTQGWSYGDPGQPGQGGLGPNLTGGASNAHFPSEADQIDFVKKGSVLGKKYGLQGQGSGRMPGFGNMLTDGQIKAIIEYVRSL